MAYREFTDADGVRWEAWDVHPTHVERRALQAEGEPEPAVEERRHGDDHAPRMQVRPEFVHGWLAFQSRHERRRLAPGPPGWHELDDEGLARLCEQATHIGQPRRLVE